MVKKQLRNDRSRFGAAKMISAVYAQSEAEGILNRFYLAASNSASISAEGAGVIRLTTTQTSRDIRKAGSSS